MNLNPLALTATTRTNYVPPNSPENGNPNPVTNPAVTVGVNVGTDVLGLKLTGPPVRYIEQLSAADDPNNTLRH